MKTLIYCYDAYCGWCYGFSPVMKQLEESFKDRLQVEVLSGGMILPETPKAIAATAGYIKEAYKTVEAYTGIKFGEDYLWHINNRNVQFQLVINNLLNDRSVIWTTSTNGAATTALRPRDGNYSSPARETVPVAFGLKQPINFNLSASFRL